MVRPRLPQTGSGNPGAAARPRDTRYEKGRHYFGAGCKQEQEQEQEQEKEQKQGQKQDV